MSSKAAPGNFFEDFRLGQEILHATPRTVTTGDVALYIGLTNSRFALQSSDEFARAAGLDRAPVDDLLTFHVVFGKSVPDISLNAVANLGYAECRFLAPVYPGDTLRATSEVVGLKENSNHKTGVVYVRTRGLNQDDKPVLDYVRWVMVRKRDEAAPEPEAILPALLERVAPDDLVVPANLSYASYDTKLAGSEALWDDYQVGERIDHVDGVTIEEAEHMIATRLYQNTAKLHFNHQVAAETRFGRRLIYGGHIISLARAISFNGLANAQSIAAINGGRHVSPCFAGDTVYAWSEVLERAEFADRRDVGAVRLRSFATKDRDCGDFPGRAGERDYHPAVVLDLDYWVLLPRRA